MLLRQVSITRRILHQQRKFLIFLLMFFVLIILIKSIQKTSVSFIMSDEQNNTGIITRYDFLRLNKYKNLQYV